MNLKTGNKKCWQVVTTANNIKVSVKPMTRKEAEQFAAEQSFSCEPCPVGYHFEVCSGDAHKPEVAGNIDHCSVCMPRWGWVMRKDSEGLKVTTGLKSGGLSSLNHNQVAR